MKPFVGRTKHLQKHFVATGYIVNKDSTKMLLEFHKKLTKREKSTFSPTFHA